MMFKKTQYSLYIFLGLFFCASMSYADSRYFLCGPDEDGCPTDGYQYCSCIAYDEAEATKPYCLDFDKMTCQPMSRTLHCNPGFIFKNQGACLATIFQSEPEPPCLIKTYSFCVKHHTMICDSDGNPFNCHHA